MSMQDLKVALHYVETLDPEINDIDFLGKRSEILVQKAEHALGLTFPPTYRRFLLDWGTGCILGQEFCGVIHDDFFEKGSSDAIWLTLSQREEFNLPHKFILIKEDGRGNYFALDSSQVNADGEYPVVICYITGQVEYEAEDFGAFMRAEIEMMLEDEDEE